MVDATTMRRIDPFATTSVPAGLRKDRYGSRGDSANWFSDHRSGHPVVDRPANEELMVLHWSRAGITAVNESSNDMGLKTSAASVSRRTRSVSRSPVWCRDRKSHAFWVAYASIHPYELNGKCMNETTEGPSLGPPRTTGSMRFWNGRVSRFFCREAGVEFEQLLVNH